LYGLREASHRLTSEIEVIGHLPQPLIRFFASQVNIIVGINHAARNEKSKPMEDKSINFSTAPNMHRPPLHFGIGRAREMAQVVSTEIGGVEGP
jgi:hypothetical protein